VRKHSNTNIKRPDGPPDVSWLLPDTPWAHWRQAGQVYLLTDSTSAERINKFEGVVSGRGPYHVKIGSSTNPARRRSQLQPSGQRYTILWVSEPTYVATWAEMWLHYMCRNEWERGDWFLLPRWDLLEIPELFSSLFDKGGPYDQDMAELEAMEAERQRTRDWLISQVPGIEESGWV